MRIYEIDDSDRAYAASASIDLDVDKLHNQVLDLFKDISTHKSARHRAVLLAGIEHIENNMLRIFKYENFNDDNSTRALKNKCKRYLREYQKLKQNYGLM